jgi:hypothetical protein
MVELVFCTGCTGGEGWLMSCCACCAAACCCWVAAATASATVWETSILDVWMYVNDEVLGRSSSWREGQVRGVRLLAFLNKHNST